MARGWESKSVESQMEDRREPQRIHGGPDAQSRLERTREREGLESTRRGVLRDLESTRSELRKRSLEAALKHLDEELNKLST